MLSELSFDGDDSLIDFFSLLSSLEVLEELSISYTVIDKTEPGIERIIAALQKHEVSKAVFFVDAPVSNSGRLKTLIAETAERMAFPIDIRMVKDSDAELKKCANVISGDSEVISECVSWYNLYEELVAELDHPWITDVS